MEALVTGAAGFIGGALARRLLETPAIERVALLDREPMEADARTTSLACDLAEPGSLGRAALRIPDLVLHCAGVTTAACEADPDAGFRVNVEGTRALLAWCRALPRPPRLLFTSSVAVFGGGEPVVDETSRPMPHSTYGALKAMAEQLVLDAGRRGEIEGLVVRLPVTVVRPSRTGRPGAGFLSDLILAVVEGRAFEAPLAADRPVPIAGLGTTLDRLLALATGPMPARPVHHVPSVAGTGDAVLAALAARGFARPAVRFRPDPTVARLIAGWPDRLASLDVGTPDCAAPLDMQALVDDHLRSRVAPAREGAG